MRGNVGWASRRREEIERNGLWQTGSRSSTPSESRNAILIAGIHADFPKGGGHPVLCPLSRSLFSLIFFSFPLSLGLWIILSFHLHDLTVAWILSFYTSVRPSNQPYGHFLYFVKFIKLVILAKFFLFLKFVIYLRGESPNKIAVFRACVISWVGC